MVPGASETHPCSAFIAAVGEHHVQLSTRVLSKPHRPSDAQPEKDHGSLPRVFAESQFWLCGMDNFTKLCFTTPPDQIIELDAGLRTEEWFGRLYIMCGNTATRQRAIVGVRTRSCVSGSMASRSPPKSDVGAEEKY